MTYQQELDDVRQEVRRGASGIVRYWPKVDGENVAVTGTPTYVWYDPDGDTLGSGNTTPTTVGAFTRCAITIDASGETDVREGHRVAISFVYSGSTYVESLSFDVVVEPMGSVNVSMNDLTSEQADAEAILLRQALQQESGRTAVQQAAVLATRAWGDVRAWLKKKVEQQGSSWPLYILNREELRMVIVARALYRMHVAQGLSNPEARDHAEWWRAEADRRFAGLPALQFSTDTDALADDQIQSFGVVEMARRW